MIFTQTRPRRQLRFCRRRYLEACGLPAISGRSWLRRRASVPPIPLYCGSDCGRGYPEQIRTSVADLSRFVARRPWWECPA